MKRPPRGSLDETAESPSARLRALRVPPIDPGEYYTADQPDGYVRVWKRKII